MSLELVWFKFDKLKCDSIPHRLGTEEVFDVYWHDEWIGYVWNVLGNWYADYTLTFYCGHMPTFRGGRTRYDVAKALRDGRGH